MGFLTDTSLGELPSYLLIEWLEVGGQLAALDMGKRYVGYQLPVAIAITIPTTIVAAAVIC